MCSLDTLQRVREAGDATPPLRLTLLGAGPEEGLPAACAVQRRCGGPSPRLCCPGIPNSGGDGRPARWWT